MSISYSDFMKEGALQPLAQPAQTFEPAAASRSFRLQPEDIANETASKAFWKELRHYYRTGENPQGRGGILVPALIAPYLRNGNWDTEFPYYLAQESATSQSLQSLLEQTIAEVLDEEAKLVRLYLPRLIAHFRGQISNGIVDFQHAKEEAFKLFLQIEIHDSEGDRFKADAAKLQAALPDKGHLLDFHHELALHLIRQKLQQIEWNRKQYKKRIEEKVKSLKELIRINQQKKGTEDAGKGFDFASDMIAFDAMQEMVPKQGSQLMSPERQERIEALIKVLDDTLKAAENHAHMIVADNLKEDYRWEQIFTWSKVSFVPLQDSFQQAQASFDRNIAEFTNVLVAMRKAELELEGKYDTQVHDDYFAHFKWFKLDQEELNIFPPVMIFARGRELMEDKMSEFSRLMTTNRPIKVVALKDRAFNPTDPNIDWEDASLAYRQELMAHALSNRNVHVLQVASDRPQSLLNGIRSGMNSIAPSLMHLLVTRKEEDPTVSFLKINAAAAGRYFPYLCYDPHKGVQWGSRFDVEDNSQPKNDWPIYPFVYQSADERAEELKLAFTYADYKAMNQEKVKELFIVPEAMVNDYLVPLQDFLYLNQLEQAGKVPFIWLVDEEDVMVRAAVPYMWVSSCLERLEFWNFIQELGGVRNYHANRIIEEERQRMEADKQEAIRKAEADQQALIDAARQESAGEAMARLAAVLLETDFVGSKPVANMTPRPAAPKAPTAPAAQSTGGEASKIVENEQLEPAAAAEEAYVESDLCTSCNDCTERYPAIFDYNEDKQALIKNAAGGSFEDLVTAAENCPAACIHPGTPLNANEPGLPELIKRAEKFN